MSVGLSCWRCLFVGGASRGRRGRGRWERARARAREGRGGGGVWALVLRMGKRRWDERKRRGVRKIHGVLLWASHLGICGGSQKKKGEQDVRGGRGRV